MWAEVSFWFSLLALVFAPGLALIRLSRLRWPRSEACAAAPGLSLALVSTSAYGVELLGLPVRPLTVGPLLLLLFGVYVALRRRGGASPWAQPAAPKEPWSAWLAFAAPLFVLVALHAPYEVFLLPPTLDDGVHHATWSRLIHDYGSLDPATIYGYPVGAEGASRYYPWGYHATVALVARWTTLEPSLVFWRCTIAIGCLLPLSCYAFAARLLPKGWAAASTAFTATLFWWLPFQPYLWGGYALLAGCLAALPVVRALLDVAEDRSWIDLPWVIYAGLGLLLIHPSQALLALLAATVFGIDGLLRRRFPRRVFALLLAAWGALWIALGIGPRLSPALRGFVELAADVARSSEPIWARGEFVGTTALQGLYLLRSQNARPVVLGLLCLVGLLVALWQTRWRVIVALHLVVVGLIVLAPAHGWLTALWYHAPERIWYLEIAAVPLLAAAGLWGVVKLLEKLLGKLLGRLSARGVAPLRRETFWGPVALLSVAVACVPLIAAARDRLIRAPRGSTLPARGFRADMAWARAHLPARELVLNSPGGPGILYPLTGRPIAFFNCQARRKPGKHWYWFRRANSLRCSSSTLRGRPAGPEPRYLYRPIIERVGWSREGPLFSPEVLAAHPRLERVYASPTGEFYRILTSPKSASFVAPLVDSPLARFEGVYPVESSGGRRFRWTKPRAKILIPRDKVRARAGCLLSLSSYFDDAKREHEVRWNGRALRRLTRGIYVLEGPSKRIEIELRSPTHRAPGDPRQLGISLEQLAIAEMRGAQSPVAELVFRELSLGGGADVRFEGFHALEGAGARRWRWSTGSGRIFVAWPRALREERVVLKAVFDPPSEGKVVLRWNGREMEAIGRHLYRVRAATEHVIEIEAASVATPGDARALGITIDCLTIYCPERRGGGP